MRPVIALAYCLESVSRLLHRERIIGRAQRSSWDEETVLRDFRDQGSWSLVDSVLEGENWTARYAGDLQRVLLVCIHSRVMIGTCEEIIWGQGKNQAKWLERTLACIHTGPRIVFLTARVEKLKSPGTGGRQNFGKSCLSSEE